MTAFSSGASAFSFGGYNGSSFLECEILFGKFVLNTSSTTAYPFHNNYNLLLFKPFFAKTFESFIKGHSCGLKTVVRTLEHKTQNTADDAFSMASSKKKLSFTTATTSNKKKRKNQHSRALLKSGLERATVRTRTTNSTNSNNSNNSKSTPAFANGLPASERKKKGRKSTRRRKKGVIVFGKQTGSRKEGLGGAANRGKRIKKLLGRCQHRIRSLATDRRPNCLFSTVQLVLATLMVALTFYALVISIWSAFLPRALPSPPLLVQPTTVSTVQQSSPSEHLLHLQIDPLPPPSPSLPFTDSRTFFWLFFLFNGHFLADAFTLFEVITSRPVDLCRYTALAADHLLYLFLGDLLCLCWTATVHAPQFSPRAGADKLISSGINISMAVLFLSPAVITALRLLLTVAFVLHFNAQLSAGGRWQWVGGGRRLEAATDDKSRKKKKKGGRGNKGSKKGKGESSWGIKTAQRIKQRRLIKSDSRKTGKTRRKKTMGKKEGSNSSKTSTKSRKSLKMGVTFNSRPPPPPPELIKQEDQAEQEEASHLTTPSGQAPVSTAIEAKQQQSAVLGTTTTTTKRQ